MDLDAARTGSGNACWNCGKEDHIQWRMQGGVRVWNCPQARKPQGQGQKPVGNGMKARVADADIPEGWDKWYEYCAKRATAETAQGSSSTSQKNSDSKDSSKDSEPVFS